MEQSTESKSFNWCYGWSKEEILSKIKKERQTSDIALNSKINLFNERQLLYNNPTKDEDKININLIFQFMMMLMSIYYTDEPEATFTTDEIWNEEIADNTNNVYKRDLYVMQMHIIKYLVQWYKFWYGVGLRIITGYDSNRNINTFQVVDPRCRRPDPNGDVVLNNFRRHWFVTEAPYYDLKFNDDYFNTEVLLNTQIRSDYYTNMQADQSHRGITNSDDNTDNKLVSIYTHRTRVMDKENRVQRVCLFTLDDAMTEVIRYEVVDPVMPDEIADPNLVQFPLIINARSPQPGDPFGICVPDVVEDKQKHMTMYENLKLIKASRIALWGDRLYDVRLIKNAAELEKPTLWWRWIWLDPTAAGVPLANAIYDIPQDTMPRELMEMAPILKQQAQQDIWLSDLTMGNLAERDVTARESQSAQMNANIRLILHNEINNRWEERFAWWMYRWYMENFPDNKEKIVRINQWLWEQNIILSKADFVSNKTPLIRISQKSDIDNLNRENKANFMAIYPLIAQDPSLPRISKTYALRKLLKLNGLTKGEISIIAPMSAEEMEARQQLELINRNQAVEVWSLDEDHFTYLIVYQRAFNTPAKFAAIEMRKQAYILSWQQERDAQAAMIAWNNWMAQSAWGQLVSNAIAKWNANNPQNAASLQQVRQ